MSRNEVVVKAKIKVGGKVKLNFPENFSIDKYSHCKHWGVHEWYEAIRYRACLLSDWKISTRKEWDEEDVVMVSENYKRHVLNILGAPLECGKIKNFSNISLMGNKAVFDHTVADLFEDPDLLDSKDHSWRGDYVKWASCPPLVRYDSPDEEIRDLVSRLENTPSWVAQFEAFGYVTVATLNVSLLHSDKELYDGFKKWLRETRRNMKLPKIKSININDFSDEILNKWHAERVLPLFDLGFYQIVFGGVLASANVVDAVFENDLNKSLDSLKDTYWPNAMAIVSPRMANALRCVINNGAL